MLKLASPSIRTVECDTEFNRSYTIRNDDAREGRKKRTSIPDIITKIQEMVKEDRRLRHLVEALGISL